MTTINLNFQREFFPILKLNIGGEGYIRLFCVFLLTILVAASVFDLIYQKIPNKFVLLTIITGLFIHVYCGRWDMLCGMGTAFVLAIPFYLLGAVGAGDVKVFMAVSMVLETDSIIMLGWYSLVVTAVYGLIYKLFCKGAGRTKVAMAPGLLMGAVIVYMKGGIG